MISAIGSWHANRPAVSAWGVRLIDRRRGHRWLVTALVDAVAWAAGVSLATMARYEGHVPRRSIMGIVALSLIAAAAVVTTGAITGLHRGRYVVGSFDEVTAVGTAFVPPAVVVILVNAMFIPGLIPLSSALASPTVALLLALAPRYAVRRSREGARGHDLSTSRRALVFGAGQAGEEIVRALLRDPHSALFPVALLDDDPMKNNRMVCGVRVMGGRDAIPRLARALRADCLLVAMPSAQPELKQALAAIADSCGLVVRILPPLAELVDSAVTVHDIREVTEADLLGRPQVDIDTETISAYLRGRVVLVTGAGGSIGSEICRQMKEFGPSELLMLDRDESALHGLQLSIEGRALLSDRNLIVADIRDRERIRELFETRRPDVVFHAAALKHLPLLEMHPEEGIKTNVWGTYHVLEAAMDFGTERFVNISTDKAADPTSVLGCTKLIAERLTAAAATRMTGNFVSVRFGNVLGSRGSVLPTFRAQIEAGGPVTVTHPDVTRYFMTTEEAVRLVMQAAVIGMPGEVLVLDMGQPVRIDELARRLIARSGRNVAICYTGLRPGEKLHERLVGVDEIAVSREHPLILHTRVPPVDAIQLVSIDAATLRSLAICSAEGPMTVDTGT
jgi:FlaA1/EpsC-like NDP-sugar epimerase